MIMGMTPALILWGLIATVSMTSIMQASQGFGLSRLSLPFLIGSAFTGDRSKATILGFALYVLGGWLFAFLYFVFFTSVGIFTWWLGAIVGAIHGIFLLTCAIPLMPYIHPRMASLHHGASSRRQLEPPGFMAVNYGYQTPVTTLFAQTVYGAVLGTCVQLQHAMVS